MKLVSLDTSGPVIGVACWCDGDVRMRTERVARGAEARLLPWILELVGEAGFSLRALDALAVTVGPGAFTGVRVGLATATGLATALDRPVWTTDALHPRALRAGPRSLALLDARKGRVYATARHDGLVHAAADVSIDDAIGWLPAPFVATGEGALVYREAIERAGGAVAPEADHPAVDTLVRLGASGLARGEGCLPNQVSATYVRGFA